MNKKARSILVITLFAFSIMGGGIYWARDNSTIFNLFFPPSGLYEPLAVDLLANNKRKYIFNVSHKYPGQYGVSVQAPSSPGIGVNYKMEFVAEVKLQSNSSELIYKKVSEPHSQFWRNNDGGIVLLNYRVPELVPKETPVKITVIISENISGFNKEYGVSSLVVRKRSDK